LAAFTFPHFTENRKGLLATGKVRPVHAAPGGLFPQLKGGPMLAYIPVRFDLYRTIRPTLRWTLQCLVGFADRAGRCFPSVRKLAEVAGISKSSISRHLAELAQNGIVTRHRRPGGCYAYTLNSRFLPAAREVSHKCNRAVPSLRTEENPTKKTERFADLQDDDRSRWEARLRSWRQSGGKFWPPFAGPRPDEPDCWAPKVLLQTIV